MYSVLCCYLATTGLPAGKRNEYQRYEAEVFEAIAALVRDAATLRVYLAAAMRVQAETFTRAII